MQRAAGGVTVTCPPADDEQDDDELLCAGNDDAVSDAGTVTSTTKGAINQSNSSGGRRSRSSEYDAMDDGTAAIDGSDSPTSVCSESFAEESGGDVSRRVTRGSVSTYFLISLLISGAYMCAVADQLLRVVSDIDVVLIAQCKDGSVYSVTQLSGRITFAAVQCCALVHAM
jgi:hypothetical protein